MVLDSFQHITHSVPYSFWPFIIFLCPTAFQSLSCSFVFSSFYLYFFSSPPPVLLGYQISLSLFLVFHVSLLSPDILPFSWPGWIQQELRHSYTLWHLCSFAALSPIVTFAVTLSAKSRMFQGCQKEKLVTDMRPLLWPECEATAFLQNIGLSRFPPHS